MVHIGSAPNNGSYTWRGEKSDSALVYDYNHGAPSGCNYSIEMKAWTDIVYSRYFTIINPDDGGLNSTSECPLGDTATGPMNQTCKCSANSFFKVKTADGQQILGRQMAKTRTKVVVKLPAPPREQLLQAPLQLPTIGDQAAEFRPRLSPSPSQCQSWSCFLRSAALSGSASGETGS